MILNLGKLEGVDKKHHKILADRNEELITGLGEGLVPLELPDDLEALAQSFAKKISKEKIFSSTKGLPISEDVKQNLQTVDLDTFDQLEGKEIGGE